MSVNSMVTRILADVDEARRQFGTYTFQDKGAQEVMDLEPLLDALKAMHPEDAADVLCELVAYGNYGAPNSALMSRLVSDLLVDLQDVDDGWWDILISRPELAELF